MSLSENSTNSDINSNNDVTTKELEIREWVVNRHGINYQIVADSRTGELFSVTQLDHDLNQVAVIYVSYIPIMVNCLTAYRIAYGEDDPWNAALNEIWIV